MASTDEASPLSAPGAATTPSGLKRPTLQLPLSCDPPGPDNPARQKTWIIFGGTGQIGRSIVKAALAHGDQVTSVGRSQADSLAEMQLVGSLPNPSASSAAANPSSPPPMASSSDQQRRPHPRLLCLLCDVRVRGSVAAAIERHLARWAGRLDVVANCTHVGIFGSCEDQDEAELRTQFDTNFWGTLNIVQLTLPHLRANRERSGAAGGGVGAAGGRYLIFSSTSGALGVPGLGPYCATKYAVEGLVESMLYEIDAFDIRATLVSPGHVRPDDPDEEEQHPPGHTNGRSSGQATLGRPPSAPGTGLGGVAAAGLLPAYGSFRIKPASGPYAGAASPAGHAKRVVQWMADRQPTSAVRAAELVWQLAHCSYPPLRLLLGAFAVDSVRDRLRTIMEEIEDWKFLSFGEDVADPEKARDRVAGREPEREESDEEEEISGAALAVAAASSGSGAGGAGGAYDTTSGMQREDSWSLMAFDDDDDGEEQEGEDYEEYESDDEDVMEEG